MLKCPRCQSESEPTGKEWKYSVFTVKLYQCQTCKKRFNAYFKGEQLSHIIGKTK